MRITAYAERLLSGLEGLNWTDSIKEAQKNWVGRSEGAVVRFKTSAGGGNVEVFTTRPDTIYGVSFMVLAPEHKLVLELTTEENRAEVEEYISAAKREERERQGEKEVTGVALGGIVLHPLTGEEYPCLYRRIRSSWIWYWSYYGCTCR